MKTITLKQLIDKQKFDWVNSDITEDVFPLNTLRSNEYKLFHFDRFISSEDVVKEMEKEGYLPANIYELLGWKDWNEKDLVIALDSVGEVDGDRYVPYLYRSVSERSLRLAWWDVVWIAYCRFLSVKMNQTKEKENTRIQKYASSSERRICKECGAVRNSSLGNSDKKKLFVPLSLKELSTANGVDYLNEVLWELIEKVNELEKKIKK